MIRDLGSRRSRVFASLLALLAGAGCGADSHPLGRDDVTGFPPGDAVGSTFSGRYQLLSAAITSCYCRVGGCTALSITIQPGPATLVQQDGALTMTDYERVTSTGGVNADGTFTVGSAQELPGAAVYTRTDGKFVLVNGQPDSFDSTATSTYIIAMPGPAVDLDCDLVVACSSRYVGP